MRRIPTLALLIFALWPTPDLARCEEAGDPRSKGEIDNVVRRNTQLFTAGNASALADEFTADAVYAATSGESYRGRDAIRGYYADILRKLGTYSRDNDTDEIHVLGDFAWAIGRGKLKVSTPDGTMELSDHWAAVFARVQGAWKIRMMSVGEDADILPMRR
jgi:uncharacterized protein (TIGR02246 family)